MNCASCGLHSEADGFGFPPEEIRLEFINLDGLWGVKSDNLKSVAITVKVIRQALFLELKEAVEMAKNISGILYLGTKVEALWLSDLLNQAGEFSVIVLMPKDSSKSEPADIFLSKAFVDGVALISTIRPQPPSVSA